MRFIYIGFILFFMVGCANKATQDIAIDVSCSSNYFSIKAVACLEQDQLIQKLEPYQVIFIGDHHTSKKLHKSVSSLIDKLSQKGYKIHLASEWFVPSDNNLLAEYSLGRLSDAQFEKEIKWKDRMRLSFSLFSPIYRSVIRNKGQIYGINMTKEDRQRIGTQNIFSMSGYAADFYKKLDLDTKIHKDIIGQFLDCHAPKKGENEEQCLKRMYLIQVAWDSIMAQNSSLIANNVLTTKRDKLLVFVGSMHLAFGVGINMRFARINNKPFVTILPLHKTSTKIPLGFGDYLLLYGNLHNN